jgi:hypothetical protein
MSLWMERLNEMQHYYALRREADQHRLARQALEGRQKKEKVYYKVMGWLGSRLSAWGDQLQEHYGTVPAAITFVRRHSD